MFWWCCAVAQLRNSGGTLLTRIWWRLVETIDDTEVCYSEQNFRPTLISGILLHFTFVSVVASEMRSNFRVFFAVFLYVYVTSPTHCELITVVYANILLRNNQHAIVHRKQALMRMRRNGIRGYPPSVGSPPHSYSSPPSMVSSTYSSMQHVPDSEVCA